MSKALFLLAHTLGDLNFYSYYKKLINNINHSYKELLVEQEKNLRNIIKYSYKSVPYYHNLFKELNIYPSDIKNIKDLEKLPILTKDVIKANWEDFKPRNLSKLKYYNNKTGGSTGKPLKYRLSNNDRFLSGAIMYRGWGYAGYELADKMVILAGASLDVGKSTDFVTCLHEFTRNIRKLSSLDLGDDNLIKCVDVINSFKPKFLRGYASSIYYFANWVEEHNVSLHSFNAVFTTADQLFSHMKDKVEEAFNCPVFDGYGLNDGGVSAYECEEHDGYHIDMERSIMEIVDENSSQIEEGGGQIISTSLFNYAMPFIRYDTGDLGIVSRRKCPCGRPFPLLEELQGRSNDYLITPEGKTISGRLVTHIFSHFTKKYEGIVQYQVVQESIQNLLIYMVVNDNFDYEKTKIIKNLFKERSNDWQVEFKFVEEIKTTEAGKHRFTINLVDGKL
jgi:phenylacetate-CoA ligase